MNDNGPRAKTTETSFRIIEAVRDNRGVGVSELARQVDLSKSAVHKHVQTLTDLGYLVREGHAYYLSNRFLSLGVRARERLPLEPAQDVVTDLAETTGHVSSFIAHENDSGVYALRVEPAGTAASDVTEGDVAPLHATAGGKAILAFLPAEKRAGVLQSVGLPAHTDKTITDREELERELRSVRDQRVAFDREEYISGHQCVASPVVGADGEPIAAVSVTGNIYHMSGKRLEEDVAGLVTSAAKSIENRLLSQ
ncbi:IclR family transcriptional regulator [Halomicroarcula sp. GCM10025817]|uniref:IclR family transcriptional regulator n=1 Tax=Haloarcula TaxID=2237 RepID=UPI0023E800C4|nr:IclR family transcriptional regulator [Halomicroarcula sp. SYNS111]